MQSKMQALLTTAGTFLYWISDFLAEKNNKTPNFVKTCLLGHVVVQSKMSYVEYNKYEISYNIDIYMRTRI